MARELAPYHYNTLCRFKAASESGILKEILKYNFRTNVGGYYIVEVEKFEHEIFLLKYYPKKYSKDKNRFNVLTNEEKLGAFKIFDTCVQIGLEILEKNPEASFGFIGSATLEEKEKNNFFNTKRFRIYSHIATAYFNPEHFDHTLVKEQSLYLIANRRKVVAKASFIKDVISMFHNAYNLETIHLRENRPR